MERRNNLSKNLRAYQEIRNLTQAELAAEIKVPKSTLQSIMLDGNTTLETLMRIADNMNVSLDELVYGKDVPHRLNIVQSVFRHVSWYSSMPESLQEKVYTHVDGIIKAVDEWQQQRELQIQQ